MKRSTKTISIILVFFLIIAIVIIIRTMIGNHFQKKFSKIPPPEIIVTKVIEKEFSEKIETFGTAISKKSKTFKIKKDDLFEDLRLKNFVKKDEILIKLKSGNILAPFSGVLGYTGLTEDILVSNNIIIITLDDNSSIYSDIKIPENYSAFMKKGLPVEVKITSYKNKIFEGEVDFVSSRINADTRSLLSRIKVDNKDLKLKNFVKKGEIIIKLKSGNIIAPFNGVLGYTGLTEDILVSNNIVIITLDDNSIVYSDIKIPENYST